MTTASDIAPWISTGIAAVALGVSFVRGTKSDAATLGALAGRVKELEDEVSRHDMELETVTKSLAAVPVMSERLEGLTKLFTQRMDYQDKHIEGVQKTLERLAEGRSFRGDHP